MADETTVAAGTTSGQTLLDICEWLSNVLPTDDLQMMVQGGERYVETFAEGFYISHKTMKGFTALLDEMVGSGGESRRCVHRSAVRDAMRFVVGAYQKFPDLAPGKRVEAYASYLRHRKVEGSATVAKKPLPSSMPIFRQPVSV